MRKGFVSGSNTIVGHKTPGEEQAMARTMGMGGGRIKGIVAGLSYQQQGGVEMIKSGWRGGSE